MKISSDDFLSYLRNDLMLRCKKNSQYSLRSYALYLQIDASSLSQILRGKRKLTDETLRRLAKKLKITEKQIENFSYELKHMRSYETVELTTFQVISDWYHFAILELMNSKFFCPDEKWIAQALSITCDEVRAALQRLEKVGFLSRNGKEWKDLTNGLSTLGATNITTPAFREFQSQILEKAIDALDCIPLEKRLQTGSTMAISLEKLPEAKKRIEQFQIKLGHFLTGGNENEEEVYQLSISLFPLSRCNALDDTDNRDQP